MAELIDMTGQRCGRLLVVRRVENDWQGNAMWECRCDCGREVVFRGTKLRQAGVVHSCGCYNHEAKYIVHGASRTRLYHIWRAMKARCYDPQRKGYEYYGGRGITVCQEWRYDFEAFQEWAYAHGYREYLTIDRIDNDKGYSPDNCRWATYSDQNRNKRYRRKKELPGATNTEQLKQTPQSN